MAVSVDTEGEEEKESGLKDSTVFQELLAQAFMSVGMLCSEGLGFGLQCGLWLCFGQY